MNAMAALDRAHRAWLAAQPQYVIPGVLDSAPLTDSTSRTRREHACRTGRTIEPANPSPQYLSPAVGGLVTARPDIRADGVSSRPAAQNTQDPRAGVREAQFASPASPLGLGLCHPTEDAS